MDTIIYEDEQTVAQLNNFLAGFLLFVGLLVGGLIGAVTMLLVAPQSGQKTRKQIRRQGRDLRVHTTDTLEDAVNQVRAKAHDVTNSIHEQAEELQHRGQDVIDHGKERYAGVVEAGKAAVNGA